MDTSIKAGDIVRSYDFPDNRDTFMEGRVMMTGVLIEDCKRYKILVNRRVVAGEELAGAMVGRFIYPPVNGTPTSLGNVTDGVELIHRESNDYDFRAFDPPVIDTFAQIWRNKVWHNLLRAMKDRNEPARAAFWLGQADAGISVLYDVNHPAAYRAKERYNLVRKICDDTAENLLHELEWKLRRSMKVYG